MGNTFWGPAIFGVVWAPYAFLGLFLGFSWAFLGLLSALLLAASILPETGTDPIVQTEEEKQVSSFGVFLWLLYMIMTVAIFSNYY